MNYVTRNRIATYLYISSDLVTLVWPWIYMVMFFFILRDRSFLRLSSFALALLYFELSILKVFIILSPIKQIFQKVGFRSTMMSGVTHKLKSLFLRKSKKSRVFISNRANLCCSWNASLVNICMVDRYSYIFYKKGVIYELGSRLNQIGFILKNGSVGSMLFFSS